MKLDILVFGAHPDDVELGCGGTVIKEVKAGKKVGIIDLTRGELGTRGTAEIRTAETKKATEIMGVAVRENMNFKDGFFKDDEAHKLAIIEKIRKYQPEIVITNAVSDRHPDHGRGSEISVDACFLSGLEKIETNQKVWRPRAIYHYIQFNNLTPDVVVDISEEMGEKLNAVKAYSTQFFNPESNESETIISSMGFLDSVTYRAKDLGRQANCEYAEGFLAHQIPKVDYLLDIK
ncbi:MAG: bacillithiol biosynthesis deacetylase BshB1 [Flavobacteriales bacterium]|jgi:N-acetylglucosamine malate deacetylase 1|nr:bacillithiol biosynthesis deacetylase BshB1 [Flavobacteriales bacterium]|tara:strand:- start:331 stop:1032 length:702 start_codon:yes stop_codon:yes gene_type:complete